MKPRRVSSALIDLDPEDVVLTKGLRPQPVSSPRRRQEAQSQMGAPATEPRAADVNAVSKTKPRTVSRDTEDGPRSVRGAPSVVGCSSRAMETTHNAVVDRAIPDSEQRKSEEISTLVFHRESEKQQVEAQHPTQPLSPNLGEMPHKDEINGSNNQAQAAVCHQGKHLHGGSSSNADPTRARASSFKSRRPACQIPKAPFLNTQESRLFPRAKCSNQRIYTSHSKTEVDWDEHLRPTDDEQFEDAGTSVSSPSAQDINMFDKQTKKKRKSAPEPRLAPGKRKRAPKRKSVATGEDSAKSFRLPLTAGSTTIAHAASCENDTTMGLALTNGQYEGLGMKNTADASGTCCKQPSEGNQQMRRETVSKCHEVIEISSSPSLTSNMPVKPEHDIEASTFSTVSKTNIQKQSSRPDGRSSKERDARKPLSSKHNGRGEAVGHKLILALHGAEVLPLRQPVNGHRAPPPMPKGAGNKPTSDRPSIRSSSAQWSPERDSMASGFGLEQDTTDSATVQQEQAEHGNAHIASIPKALRKKTASSLQRPLSFRSLSSSPVSTDVEISSERSNAARSYPVAPLLKEREDDHTPESQKPLLADQMNASCSKAPRSIARNSIVDQNGSPRLMFQAKEDDFKPQSNLENGLLYKSKGMTDSSESACDQDSDRLSVECSSESGLPLTNFQRNIFLGYGVKTKELTREGDHRRPDFSKEQSPLPPNDTSAYKASAAKSPATTPSSFHRTVQEIGAGSDTSKHHNQKSDKPLPAKAATSSRPSGEPHRSSTGVDHDPMGWVSSLHVAQKSAHDMLLETNEHLSRQLAAEKDTISRVLEIYRQGCNRILDDLRQAQKVRVELYHQQMVSVKDQHAHICQDLIQGLQELDRRLQQDPI